MSQNPAPPTATLANRALNFSKRLGLIVSASLMGVVVITLALGQFNAFGLSSYLFWAAFVLLAISVWPVVAEMGSTVSLAKQATLDKKNVAELIEAEKARRDKWIARSILYGAAGFLHFALSFVVATWFAAR